MTQRGVTLDGVGVGLGPLKLLYDVPDSGLMTASTVKMHFFGGTKVAQQAAIVSITDGTLGTASDALAEITASYVEATIANAFASLAAKNEEVLVILRNYGLIKT